MTLGWAWTFTIELKIMLTWKELIRKSDLLQRWKRLLKVLATLNVPKNSCHRGAGLHTRFVLIWGKLLKLHPPTLWWWSFVLLVLVPVGILRNLNCLSLILSWKLLYCSLYVDFADFSDKLLLPQNRKEKKNDVCVEEMKRRIKIESEIDTLKGREIISCILQYLNKSGYLGLGIGRKLYLPLPEWPCSCCRLLPQVGSIISFVEGAHSALMVDAVWVPIRFHCPCLIQVLVCDFQYDTGLQWSQGLNFDHKFYDLKSVL